MISYWLYVGPQEARAIARKYEWYFDGIDNNVMKADAVLTTYEMVQADRCEACVLHYKH